MAAAATAFAACSNDENVADGPVAAQVNAEIYNIVGTRAAETTWANTDAIGVSVLSVENYGKTTGNNVKYTRKNDNTGFETTSPIYFQDKEKVTFRAYYPFTETADMTDGKIISTSTADQTKQNTFDFMFATDAKADKDNSVVSFKKNGNEAGTSFQHCMSQLTFEFVAGTGVDNLNELTQYTINSLNMSGTFNTETGVAAANTTTPDKQDLVFSLSGISGSSYTAASVIIFPQGTTNNTFDIEITLAGQTYKATLTLPADTDSKFKAGYNLKYTVTINKTGLQVGEADIYKWITVTIPDNSATM